MLEEKMRTPYDHGGILQITEGARTVVRVVCYQATNTGSLIGQRFRGSIYRSTMPAHARHMKPSAIMYFHYEFSFCFRTINNIQIYMTIDGVEEIGGLSMFWYLMSDRFWCKTNKIHSHEEVVATVVFDLPKFDKNSFCDAYGTISYEINDKQYQTPVPEIRLHVEETVDNSYGIKFSTKLDYSILVLKSISTERNVGIRIKGDPEKSERLLKFLEEKSFVDICTDVYVVKGTGSLMFCLIEIVSIVEGEARLRIYSRSVHQMNIVLRLLRDQFPDIIVPDDNNSVYAAMVLIEELKLYLRDASTAERQMARIKTDLFIP